MSSQPAVQIRNLHKTFTRRNGSKVPAINDTNIEIEAGEFVVLLGPSGCGKTTLLRAIAGLEDPDEGRIDILSKSVFDSSQGINLAPEHRNLSMMFQSYALWPHMTTAKNVAYPLENDKQTKWSKKDRNERVREVLTQVGIIDLIDQYPAQMSGGQQQRVALARALVNNRSILLFDEPLSNVDAKVREELRIQLLMAQKEFGFTAVLVTHDQSEAMELATRIAVLDKGRVQQFGTPDEIYDNPANEYVAKFVGSTNTLLGSANTKNDLISTAGGKISRKVPGDNNEVSVLWRPEKSKLHRTESSAKPGGLSVSGTLTAKSFMGSYIEYHLATPDGLIKSWSVKNNDLQIGDQVHVTVEPEDLLVFDRPKAEV